MKVIYLWPPWLSGRYHPRSSYLFGGLGARLEVRAKRLDDEELGFADYAYVTVNKLTTVGYVVYAATTIRGAGWVEWVAPATPLAALGVLATVPLCLCCYDAVYVPFHRAMHLPAFYPWVHKHHHRQRVPFRGTFDGINAHPLEFAFGEFLHIWALRLAGLLLGLLGLKVPFWGAMAFLLTGGLMASLNHTRFGIRVPYVYDVRTHDVHHRRPVWNRPCYSKPQELFLGPKKYLLL